MDSDELGWVWMNSGGGLDELGRVGWTLMDSDSGGQVAFHSDEWNVLYHILNKYTIYYMI
ncbi:hypothetical protein PACILC2_08900 [Paenibacillus cisolokensis]|uniref:Uncharacterized protein n=1 Tax=Paenibacillus cisolokensis TaxID=1658519 RepID=A0ABQ4N2C5_9BACL|nr:hypothetical protein PACILC2_08900 [Paenibacillus cisolokensis]